MTWTPKQQSAILVFEAIDDRIDNPRLISLLLEAGAASTRKGAESMIRRFTRGYKDSGQTILLEKTFEGSRVFFQKA